MSRKTLTATCESCDAAYSMGINDDPKNAAAYRSVRGRLRQKVSRHHRESGGHKFSWKIEPSRPERQVSAEEWNAFVRTLMP